jgi:ankyrin repeat protein
MKKKSDNKGNKKHIPFFRLGTNLNEEGFTGFVSEEIDPKNILEFDPKVKGLIQAAMSGDIEQVKRYIEEDVDANRVDPEYGDTALSQAAFKGYTDIVELLLNKQPSDYSKNLALILACQAGHESIVDKLLANGADVNAYFEDYHTPLFQAIVQNKMNILEKLLEAQQIKINFEDKKGVIPLLVAAYNGRFAMVQKLHEKGADLSIKNKDGETAKSITEKKKKAVKSMEEQRKYTEIVDYIDKYLEDNENKDKKDYMM